MPNLYDEAIADAKSLKEMAERNARNRIIESISPQIRRMVERQILAEQDEDSEVPNLDLDALPDETAPAAPPTSPAPGLDPMSAVPGVGAPDPDEEVTHTVTTKTASGTEVKINVRVDKHGEASAAAETDAAEGDDVEVSLNKESLEALADMVLGETRQKRASLGQIRRQFESLKKVSAGLPLTESANFRSAYAILVKNVEGFRNHLISNGGTPEIRKKFNSIVKEMRDMSTSARFRRLLEEMESKPKLRREAKLVFEPADLEGLDDTVKEKLKAMTFGVDLGEEDADAMGGEMPVDVADTGAGAPAAPPAPPAAPPAPSEYDDLDEMYDEDDDDDLDEMYDEDDDDEMDEMYDEMDEQDDDDEMDEEVSFKIDESMLRRELRRLREAKGKNAKGIKNPMAKDFGGGKVENLPEELNALSESDELDEEADEVAEKAIRVAKKATDAAKQERAARVEEARMNRSLKAKLVESVKEANTLREQLEEVNLFNAKLLYVNKLMQNRDLTPRQQRAIVESLDAAKSVREAKLLYTSLTESLKSKSGTMTEGRILGSSSRSTRPGSSANLNESVEVDRWAILAGIKSGK